MAIEKIQLAMEIVISKTDKAFLVRDASGEWDEVVGIARGIHYAINNFIENFNRARYLDDNGKIIHISSEDVIRPKRDFGKPRKTIDLPVFNCE